MSPEQLAVWEEWLAGRPPAIQEVARRYPPNCYRNKNNDRAHYILHAYEEPKDDSPVTVKVIHGADSFAPGFMVFGFKPDDLVVCGCGKWEPATDEQTENMARCVDALRALRQRAGH